MFKESARTSINERAVMTLAYPLVLLFFPAIALAYLIRSRQRKNEAVPVSSATLATNLPRTARTMLRKPILTTLATLTLASLCLAAARPQRIRPIPNASHARNLMIALDLSRSMETPDFNLDGERASRIAGVKSVVSDLLAERGGDRVGLVVFGAQAFLQSPLTLDHELIERMVDSLRCGVAGDGTAIGDGLGLSVKRVEKKTHGTRAIVLITDGVNNSGNVNPLKAAQVAKDLGIKVHTIGIGSTEPLSVPLFGGFITQRGGQAEFDEKLLREIATITGGKYSAAGSSQDLREIYREIEHLDRTEEDSPYARQVDEFYQPLALVAGLLYLAALLLSRTYFLKVPCA